jgi:hypothetical protein
VDKGVRRGEDGAGELSRRRGEGECEGNGGDGEGDHRSGGLGGQRSDPDSEEAVVDEGDEERLFRRVRGASESGARVAAANAECEVELLGPARQEPADPESNDEEETTGVPEADPAVEVRELPSPSKEGTLSVAEKLLPASAEVGSEAADAAKDTSEDVKKAYEE